MKPVIRTIDPLRYRRRGLPMRLPALVAALGLLGACAMPSGPAPFETLPAGTGPVPVQISAPTDVAATDAAQPEKSTRMQPLAPGASLAPITLAPSQPAAAGPWRIADIRVIVPDTLSVSEANLFIPNADIVWREDPYGDRRAQVAEILDLALRQAALGLDGQAPVVIEARLRKFHALSQKARATVGGIHRIAFDVTIRDQSTGRPLRPPFPVEISLKAYGGQKAIAAEMRGETQKVRIMREVARVMRRKLVEMQAARG